MGPWRARRRRRRWRPWRRRWWLSRRRGRCEPLSGHEPALGALVSSGGACHSSLDALVPAIVAERQPALVAGQSARRFAADCSPQSTCRGTTTDDAPQPRRRSTPGGCRHAPLGSGRRECRAPAAFCSGLGRCRLAPGGRSASLLGASQQFLELARPGHESAGRIPVARRGKSGRCTASAKPCAGRRARGGRNRGGRRIGARGRS